MAGSDSDAGLLLLLLELEEEEAAGADDSWSDVETGASAIVGGCKGVGDNATAVSDDCSSVVAMPCAVRGPKRAGRPRGS